jgi:hypothetical protein
MDGMTDTILVALSAATAVYAFLLVGVAAIDTLARHWRA